MAGLLLRLYHGKRMLVSIAGFLAVIIVLSQFWVVPSGRYIPTLPPEEEVLPLETTTSPRLWDLGTYGKFGMVEGVGKNGSELRVEREVSGHTLVHERNEQSGVDFSKDLLSMRETSTVEDGVKQLKVLHKNAIGDNDVGNVDVSTNYSIVHGQMFTDTLKLLGTRSVVAESISDTPMHKNKQVVLLEAGSKNDSSVIERYVRKMRGATVTLSEMKSILLRGPAFTTSVRRRGSTPCDRQLLSASLQTRNAPVLRNVYDLHAPLYRNVSVFKRSYDLMERLLKIYVYKEGEKPIFHHPRLRGLYVAEGWFMKLLEGNKHFTVRDPKKAHLYYLPFSSETLRTTLYDKNSHSIKDLEHYLTNYVDLIKTRYRFWNRTGGADHFFVACHDWGPRITGHHMSSCIRGLCNANVARGFNIGNDVSIPVTYVRSGNNPTKDIGGKPPSERNILAFFAGQLHGYLRPLLLQYWGDKVPDMKIFGPMQRDIQGKAVYREYMKSSKYCICARGYGVHTPRVVESIFYECIPVIISDNYVPPLFEVLDWEAFAVFVQEKDIPNLRNILLSIPEERYLEMQQRLRMVQRHFIWHKTPEKYDLFHMILHSFWYNRVSQIRPA